MKHNVRNAPTLGAVDATPDNTVTPDSAVTPDSVFTRRQIIVSSVLGVVALAGVVVSAGFTVEPTNAAETANATAQITQLRTEVRQTRERISTLPSQDVLARSLVTAYDAAQQLATLQNDYRYMTPNIAATGTLSGRHADEISRNIAPFFITDVSEAAAQPWFIMAADAHAPQGIGLPGTFASNFVWVASEPFALHTDGFIHVSWRAVTTRDVSTALPQGTEVAWAQGVYDTERTVFTQFAVFVTERGESARLSFTVDTVAGVS